MEQFQKVRLTSDDYVHEGIYGGTVSIVPGTKTTPNQFGVYEAHVQGKTSNNGKSSFFPTSMTPGQIIDEMQQAFPNRTYVDGNRWSAFFSNGIEVNFYLDNAGQIISFFPIP